MKTDLPMRDGVGASTVQLGAGPWRSILQFLVARFPEVSGEVWHARMARGLVLDCAGRPLAPDSAYTGTRVHYYREIEDEPEIPFSGNIIHRDEHLLIADKPHFLPVTPAGRFVRQTLLARLNDALGLTDLVPLHRIDRDTAGLVMFSVNPHTRGAYQGLFPQRAVRKVYEAIAPALPEIAFPLVRRSRLVRGEPFFRTREVEGEPNSETRIEVRERRGALSLYALEPVTGRKHQLRVHLAALGAPILNDPLYPQIKPQARDAFSRPLQLLARALEFDDPLNGEHRRFESLRSLQTL